MAIEGDAIEQHSPKRFKPNLPEHLPEIPPEIITDILSRLPVKSLLRFRSVSKSWCFMISNPKFVKEHLTLCSNDAEIAHHKIIYVTSPHFCKYVTETCHLSPVLSGFCVKPMGLDYPMKQPQFPDMKPVRIVGSIDGLIFIVIEGKKLFLWNPCTRVSKKLPDTSIKLRGEDFSVYGFGYDVSTDDYKVVAIARTCRKRVYSTKVMVYSSRIGFWRKIGDFPLNILDKEGKFVNGAIHWPAIKCSVQMPDGYQVIVSIDLANETYGEIAPPTYDKNEGRKIKEKDLIVLGEWLCMSFDIWGECGDHLDVWIMKEYGVREPWTKFTTIPYPRPIHFYRAYPIIFHLSKKGEILMEFDFQLVVFDIQTRSLRKTNVGDIYLEDTLITYVESLVSP